MSVETQLVVARFEEDIGWLMQPRFAALLPNTIVYNKGRSMPPESIQRAVKTIVQLPNVGKNDHTYLHHIVHAIHSGTLAERTVFLPGSVFSSARDKPHRFEDVMAYVTNNKPIPMLVAADLRAEFRGFTMATYAASSDANNALANSERHTFPAPVRPFDKWLDSVIGAETPATDCPYMYRGILCATRSSVALTPTHVFEALLHQTAQHSNPEVGHFVERLWGYLINRGMYRDGHVVSLRSQAPTTRVRPAVRLQRAPPSRKPPHNTPAAPRRLFVATRVVRSRA